MATLWDIDHETGDLSQYDATVTDGGDLSVSNAAALAGSSWGLDCNIDDINIIYGSKNQAGPASGKYRIRFYIDINGLTMALLDTFDILYVRLSGAPWYLWIVKLRKTGAAEYSLWFRPYDDGGVFASDLAVVTDDVHYIEVYVTQATDAVSADGTYEWWIDGVSAGAWINRDNFDVFNDVALIRAGVLGADAGTSGHFYIDEIEANDDGSEIGAHVPAVTGVTKRNRIWIEHPERFTSLRRYSLY